MRPKTKYVEGCPRIHRSRQGSSTRIQSFLNEPPPKFEVTVELGSQGKTPLGIAHTASKISFGRYTRRTNQSQQAISRKRDRMHSKGEIQNHQAATPASLKQIHETGAIPRE